MSRIEIRVPDIGDFKSVAIIEIHVSAGSIVKLEDPLITLESDKASLEVPADTAGTIEELTVKLGDKVSKGDLIGYLTGSAKAAPAKPAASASKATPAPAAAPAAAAPVVAAGSYSGTADQSCDLVVLGAGPGGYSAAFRAADLGQKVILIERYATLGGVCLNVGCIPSKALLHTAAVMDEVATFASHGITFAKPTIDLDKVRAHKDGVIAKLTGGLAGMAKARKVTVVTGEGRFVHPHHIQVTSADGKATTIKFAKAIIAAGSQAVKLPFLPDDPRIVTSTGALALPFIPKSMLVIGGGIIGLEMATVYSALGARVDVVELMDGLMQGADRDLVKVWEKKNAHRFDRVMLKTKCTAATAKQRLPPRNAMTLCSLLSVARPTVPNSQPTKLVLSSAIAALSPSITP
jgi:dihydrolipoamide dehydrogenase